jgi:hypothetical protein
VKIEVGQRRDGNVEVLKGLTANDTVVTAGQLKIRDGVPVTLAARPTGSDAAAASTPNVPAGNPAANGATAEGMTSRITPAKAENISKPTPKS